DRLALREIDAAIVLVVWPIASLQRDVETSRAMRHDPPCGRIENLIGHHHKRRSFVFLAHGTSRARAKAIMRERTHALTSAVGGMGWGALPQGGHAPTFSLYL